MVLRSVYGVKQFDGAVMSIVVLIKVVMVWWL